MRNHTVVNADGYTCFVPSGEAKIGLLHLSNRYKTIRARVLIFTLGSEPMPEYMIEILNAASNQITTRTILEGEMRKQQSIYLDAAQKIMRARSDDSTFTFLDQIEELKQWRNLPTEYELIEYYLEVGEYETAMSRYANIPAICDLNSNAQVDYELFFNWLILMRAIRDDNTYMDSLPQAYINALQQLADDHPFSTAGNSAMIVLNEYYGGQYYVSAYVPQERAVSKNLIIKRKSENTSWMNVYPDPAINLVNIQVMIPETYFKQGKILITDSAGKLLEEFSVLYPDHLFTLDLTNWKPGQYNVTLVNGASSKLSKKLQIIR